MLRNILHKIPLLMVVLLRLFIDLLNLKNKNQFWRNDNKIYRRAKETYQAINLYRESCKYAERNVSFEEILNDYFSECGECDTYPILQYHFEAFGYQFSVNNCDLGKALSQLQKKKQDILLMYYFTNFKLTKIAGMLGKPHQSQLHSYPGITKIA